MKNLILVLAVSYAPLIAMADDVNSNNTIIIKPIISNGCCQSKCKAKVKTIIKKEIVEKQVLVDRPVEKIVIKKVRKNNRISLLGGVGPTRLDQPSPVQVDLIKEPVFGLQYQRNVSDSINIGIQAQTNQTVLGSVGLDF